MTMGTSSRVSSSKSRPAVLSAQQETGSTEESLGVGTTRWWTDPTGTPDLSPQARQRLRKAKRIAAVVSLVAATPYLFVAMFAKDWSTAVACGFVVLSAGGVLGEDAASDGH